VLHSSHNVLIFMGKLEKYSFIDTNLIHNFYVNYIKLSSSTCFERHPLSFRRSIMLIVHVCSLWYSLQVAVFCTCKGETTIHGLPNLKIRKILLAIQVMKNLLVHIYLIHIS